MRNDHEFFEEEKEIRENPERERNGETCPGCGKRCPADDLSCERGRAVARGETPPEHGRRDGRGSDRPGVEYVYDDRVPGEIRVEVTVNPHDDPHGGLRGPEDGERCFGHRGQELRGPEGRGLHHGPEGRGPHHGPHRPPMPLEDDGSLSFLFFRASHVIRHPGRRGDTRERILRILMRHGEVSQRALQEHLGVQPGSLSELLAKMENGGLITRERDGEDKRRVTLGLTDEGKAAAAEASAKDEESRFAALTTEEKETLRALLTKLSDAAGKPGDGPEE